MGCGVEADVIYLALLSFFVVMAIQSKLRHPCPQSFYCIANKKV